MQKIRRRGGRRPGRADSLATPPESRGDHPKIVDNMVGPALAYNVGYHERVFTRHPRQSHNERTGPMTTKLRYIGLDVHKETIAKDLVPGTFVAPTQSQLSADEVWIVRSDGESKRTDPQQFGEEPTEDRDCVVLRSSTGNWSYAEMTHPLDQGTWQLARSKDGKTLIRRNLGGSFLEKGVIRRLRFRGAFLPRENDLERAVGLFKLFATESPPLTA